MMDKVPTEVSKYFSNLGKKGGASLLKQRGRDYYVQMALKREAAKRRILQTKEVKNEK